MVFTYSINQPEMQGRLCVLISGRKFYACLLWDILKDRQSYTHTSSTWLWHPDILQVVSCHVVCSTGSPIFLCIVNVWKWVRKLNLWSCITMHNVTHILQVCTWKLNILKGLLICSLILYLGSAILSWFWMSPSASKCVFSITCHSTYDTVSCWGFLSVD